MAILNKEQRDAFASDGYLVLSGALPVDQLEVMRAEFAGWVEESRFHDGPFGEMMDGRPRFDVEPGHCAESPALRRVASPTEIAPVFLEVLSRSPVPQIVAELIGPDLRLHHSKINSKLPGSATQVKWHQDFTFDPHSNDDLVTVLVFLDDVTEENGPLKVVPETHKGPLLPLWHDGRFTGTVGEAEARQFDRTAVSQTGKAGSVCIMHSRVAHASSENRSDRARTLFIAAIAAADAVPLATNAVPSTHAGMILHGSEPGRIRTTPFDMKTPQVPEGASFFDQQAGQ